MILIVDMNSGKDSLGIPEFVLPIAYVVREHGNFDIRHFSEVDLESLRKYGRVILSGAPLRDNGFARGKERFSWIRDCGIPVLGICAGMQAIGLAFGSSLEECTEIGMVEVKAVKDNLLFSSDFRAYGLHNRAVRPSGDLEILARSGKCIQAVKHRDKAIYGVLFHPEVRNRGIIGNFIKKVR